MTMGIPRLRELLMTATKTPSAPTMHLPLRRRDVNVSVNVSGKGKGKGKKAKKFKLVTRPESDASLMRRAEALASSLSQVTLHELVDSRAGAVRVDERLAPVSRSDIHGTWNREYR